MNKKGLIVAFVTFLAIAGITMVSRHQQPDTRVQSGGPATVMTAAGPVLAKVELYTTTWCPACREAVKFLQEKNVPFVEYDIERDRAADRRFREMSPSGSIPLAVIGGEKIFGFDPQAYGRALGLQ